MDAAARFGLGNALHTVYAAFELQYGIGALAVHHKLHFLHAADSGFINVYEFGLPVTRLDVVDVHAVQLGREKRRLITACARTDFDDNILLVKRVLRKKQNLHLLLQALHVFLGGGKLFLQHLPHLLVAFGREQVLAVGNRLLRLLVLGVRLNERLHVALFLHQFAETLGVARHHRVGKLQLHFLISLQ